MKKAAAALVPVVVLLTLIPVLVQANSGDFSGGVAIGTSYAGVDTAPTNGLIVQGVVGIGTTSLGTNAQLAVDGGMTLGTYGGNGTAAPSNGLAISGHTLMGNSSSIWGGVLEVASSSNAMALPEFSADSNGAFITLSKSRTSSIGGNTAVQNNDFIGGSAFDGANGTNYQQAAVMGAKVDGTNISTTSMPGRFEFYTTPSGSVTPALALTINSSQEAVFAGKVNVGSFAAASATTVCQNSGTLSTCSSARRFKEKIRPSTLGLKEVLAMKPVTFDFRNHKDDWEKHDFGLVAEDMETINPLFTTYNAKGEIDGVRYMQLTAVNVKAIQELHALVVKQQEEIRHIKLVATDPCQAFNWLGKLIMCQ